MSERQNPSQGTIEWMLEIGFEFQEKTWREDAHFHLAQFTGQGDYVGGTVERSNRECMLEEFPMFLSESHSGYGYSHVVVDDATELRTAFMWENHEHHAKAVELVEGVQALHDYPCWDDEALSELEQELISEELAAQVDSVWSEVVGNWDEDLVPFPAGLKQKIVAALCGASGRYRPEFETGCIVSFQGMARKQAVEIAQEHMVKWEKGIREAIREDNEIPCLHPWVNTSAGIDAEAALAQIIEIAQRPKFPFEAVEAVRQIAAILNHPEVAA